ncbi:hypothetical protein J3E69DRAFT_55119 [Trichoderma sp. SZMC 28015]
MPSRKGTHKQDEGNETKSKKSKSKNGHLLTWGARVNEASWAAHWPKMRRGQPIRSGILVFATVASCSFQQLFFHLFRTVGGTRNYLCRVAGYCFIFLPLSLYFPCCFGERSDWG